MVFMLPGYIEILIISVALSIVSTLIMRVFSDQTAIKAMKADMKALNQKIKKAQKESNQNEVSKLSGELMKLSGKQFQMNMKPMFISMLMFIVVVYVILNVFFVDVIVNSPINIPLVGNKLGWFHWYFITYLPGSFMWRKLLNVE